MMDTCKFCGETDNVMCAACELNRHGYTVKLIYGGSSIYIYGNGESGKFDSLLEATCHFEKYKRIF